MEKELTTKERFNILRGYYDSNGFHSRGGEGLDIDVLLKKLGFETLADFSIWYKSLTPDEIKKEKDEWGCTGKCCHSILLRLLKLSKIPV